MSNEDQLFKGRPNFKARYATENFTQLVAMLQTTRVYTLL